MRNEQLNLEGLQDIEAYVDYFNQYTNSFLKLSEPGDHNCLLKKKHCLRVMELARKLAHSEGFDKRLQFLVSLAALFHDLGRFEQYIRYKTFNDRLSVNHARLGVRILHSRRALYSLSDRDRKIICLAILYHNRRSLPAALNHDLNLISRAVRDADKLDIFPIIITSVSKDTEESNKITLNLENRNMISPQILGQIKSGKMADYNLMRYKNDFLLLLASWVYDLNYASSFARIINAGYVRTIFKMLPRNREMRDLENKLLVHLEKRVAGQNG